MFIDKNVGKERIKIFIENVENKLLNICNDRIFWGNVFFFMHYCLILWEFVILHFFYNKYIFAFFLFITIFIHGFIFIYFGAKGCILTRIERHFYNDKTWIGPISIFLNYFKIQLTVFIINIVDLSVSLTWCLFIIVYLHKLFLFFYS